MMKVKVNEPDVTGDKWVTTMEHRGKRPVAWAKSNEREVRLLFFS